jgi:hypothetical protein
MKKLPDEIAMSVDDNFQFGIDFFLITVVIHQIFFGTARSADLKESCSTTEYFCHARRRSKEVNLQNRQYRINAKHHF